METRSKHLNIRIRPSLLEQLRKISTKGFTQADIVEEALWIYLESTRRRQDGDRRL